MSDFWKTVKQGRAMTPEERVACDRIRRHGRWRFLLTDWLPRGLAFGLAAAAFLEYRAGEWEGVVTNWLEVLTGALVIGVMFTVLVGSTVWSAKETKYREAGGATGTD